MAEPTRVDAVSRRTVLKGVGRHRRPGLRPGDHRGLQLAGASTAPSGAASAASAGGQRGRRAPRHRLAIGSYGSNDPTRPEGGLAGDRRRVHRGDRHRDQDQHRRPRHLPGPDRELPRRHAGHGVHVVLRVPHEVLRRPGPQRRRSTTCGPRSRATTPRASQVGRSATTARSTSSRSTTTRGPSSTARASSRTRGTRSPRRWDELKALRTRCRPTASCRSPSATRTAGRRWARSTSSTSGSTATTSTSA